MLRKDSHLIEPPPRKEEFKIEWRCISCGITGRAVVGHRQNAREVFHRMYINHKNRVEEYITWNTRISKCTNPTFRWARVE